MTVRAARRIVIALLVLYAVFLTWPGIVPFNRIEPLVLGLPFVMFWIACWVVLVGVAFALLNALETREEDRRAAAAATTSHADGSFGSAPGKAGA